MSYIARVGNLASTPTLKHGDKGPYLYARILVTDRVRRDGEWVDGPVVPYEVAVQGEYAVNLHRTAKAGGNVRVFFSGPHWVDEHTPEGKPTRLVNKVKADEIGISLQFDAWTVLPDEDPQTDAVAQGAVAPPATPPAAPTPDFTDSSVEAPRPTAFAKSATAFSEMESRVRTLETQRYLNDHETRSLVEAAQTFVADPAAARVTITAALSAINLPAAVVIWLMSVVDQFEGKGHVMDWNEAALKAPTSPATTAPAPWPGATSTSQSQQAWDTVAQARQDIRQ